MLRAVLVLGVFAVSGLAMAETYQKDPDEVLYDYCMTTGGGNATPEKCGCAVSYLSMNPSPAQWDRIAITLAFQRYVPAPYEVKEQFGVDDWGAQSASALSIALRSRCSMAPPE
jgi:hypothetical protein